MNTLTTSSLFLAASLVPAAADLGGPLIDPAGLNAALSAGEVQVIDIRAADKEGYAGGHIAGAISAPYGLFRGPAENPGQVPDVDTMEQTLNGLGLDPAQSLVVTYQGSSITDFGAAARVYWTLKSLGFDDMAILNGGIETWTAAKLPLSSDVAAPAPASVDYSWDNTWTATAQDVQAIISGSADARLIDARPESFWNGEEAHPAAARPGTLPQSEYFVHSSWFGDGPAIIDASAAVSLAQSGGLAGEGPLVSFCNTGHWAATNWFAMSELAGLDDVRLFPESMVGWSNAGYEMANVPGRFEMLWRQIKSVF